MESKQQKEGSSFIGLLKRYWIYFAVGLLLLIATATTLTIVLVRNSKNKNNASTPSPQHPMPSNPPIRDIFAKYKQYPKACSRAPGPPKDRRTNKTAQVTFANYNVEWLFLFGESYNCPGKGCTWATVDEAWEHYFDVEETVKNQLLGADVIHFTEVEDCRALKMLVERLPAGHGYEAFLLPDTAGPFGQSVGMLSRIDPSVDLRHVSGSMNYPIPTSTIVTSVVGRETFTKNYMTEFQFQAGGKLIHLLLAGLHMTANPQDPAKSVRREAQAALTANDINAWHRNNPQGYVVALGDYNDFDPTLSVNGRGVPISQTLNLLRNSIPGIVNVMSHIPANRRATHKSGSTIDHILTNCRNITNARVVRTPKLRLQRVSDHMPTVVTLEFV